ncbi:MAG: hypothetical protein AAF491_02165 [Verrucomicrobiota bacterium]
MTRFLPFALLASLALPYTLLGQEKSAPANPDETERAPIDPEIAPLPEEPAGSSALMTVAKLEAILSEIGGDTVQKTGNAILFEIRGIDMLCVYDEGADRMRIISPIKPYDEVTAEEKDAIMDANFRGALDGRYASSNGVLYAAYIHPLSRLSREQLLSGIFQVASLRVSFGEQYSSGLMTYGGERGTAI